MTTVGTPAPQLIEWTQWGATKPELPARMQALLRKELGPTTPSSAALISDARLPESALPAAAAEALRRAVGTDHVLADAESRARHAGGQAYAEIVRRRAGDASAAPDAVLLPGDAGEVAAVLRACGDAGVAVVPWGGGTSVVGGLESIRGKHSAVIALDLARL